MNKVLIELHCQLLHEHAFPQFRRMPLYAYMPARGSKDYLLIVSAHCKRVRDLWTLHQRDADPAGIWGGLQMSLDLEKAFDIVGRNHVLKALAIFDRLFLHNYCLSHKDIVGRFRTHRGIKQGARDAPLVWIVYMYHFLHQFLERTESQSSGLNLSSSVFLYLCPFSG